MGATTPISLGIVLFVESSMSIYKIPQVSKEARMAPKLKSETFKKRTLIGTKKKIITIKQGT